MKLHTVRALTLALLAVLLPACGGGGGDSISNLLADAPAPSGSIVVLGQDNALFFVNPANPGVILDSKLIWGVQPGTTIVAISFRPATGQLFGHGSDGRLYFISTANGFAELANFASIIFVSTNFFGMDFSPTSDRIRLVTESDFNGRRNPTDGFFINDTALTPAGDIVAVAYTNSFVGATTTTLYGIDSTSDQLVMIGGLAGTPSPNAGAVTNVGPLGVNTLTISGTPFMGAGFDISPGGIAYAALSVNDLNAVPVTGLYTIDLATGAATLIGPLGAGGPIRAISIAP